MNNQSFSTSRQYVDYAQIFKDLARCLAEMKANPNLVIYFGNPDLDKRHHRISIIATPGGYQYAFHRASMSIQGWQYGSGEYVGYPDNTEPLIDVAQRHLQDYYRDSAHPMVAVRQQQHRARDQFRYFTLEAE